MPIWLIIQLALLLLCIIVASLLYRFKFWKVNSLIQPKDVLKFLFCIIVPLTWMILSIIFGFIYIILVVVDHQSLSPILFLLIIPITLVLAFFSYVFLGQKALKYLRDKEIKDLKKTELNCKHWLQQFSFLEDESVHLNLYISDGKSVGRMIIENVTERQKNIIEAQNNELPEGVYLQVKVRNSSSGYLH